MIRLSWATLVLLVELNDEQAKVSLQLRNEMNEDHSAPVCSHIECRYDAATDEFKVSREVGLEQWREKMVRNANN